MTMFLLFQNLTKQVGFLSGSGITQPVVKHEHHFHLFDSHASNANGFPDPTGKAVAMYFPYSLYRHYRQLRIQQNMTPDQQIDVFSVQILNPPSTSDVNLNLLVDRVDIGGSCSLEQTHTQHTAHSSKAQQIRRGAPI